MVLNSCNDPVPFNGNIEMHGHIISEKWCNRTSLLCKTFIEMSFNRSYSIGITDGNLAHAAGLFVDQANVCAEPHATFVIFLP